MVAVVAVVAGLANACTAWAQTNILTINAGYAAGPPPTSTHSGTFSISVKNIKGLYRIKIDFGNVAGNGVFTLLQGAGWVAVQPNAQGNGSWTTNPPGVQLNNAQITHIRAILQQDVNQNGTWVDLTTAYNTCP